MEFKKKNSSCREKDSRALKILGGETKKIGDWRGEHQRSGDRKGTYRVKEGAKTRQSD